MLLRGPIESPYTRVHGWLITYSPKWGVSARGRTSRAGQYPAAWQTVLSNRSHLAAMWKGTLTAAQRAAWQSYATATPVPKESNRTIWLNGFQWFCRQNLTALRIGRPLYIAPPTGALSPSIAILSVTYISHAQFQISWDNTYAWTKDLKAWAIVIERGPSPAGSTTRKAYSRIAGLTQGNPPFGYPAPVTYNRAYPSTQELSRRILVRLWHDP